ncbi:MAG: DUF5063 domain-containing protein [Bacteroidales bacterium]|nr:DUF5063 domain-containing protein [Bacteroidales bacterium]
MDTEIIVDSQNTKDLLLVSNQYCTFIEKIHLFEQSDALDYLLKIIPLLYIKGTLIPRFEVDDDAAYERFVTEESYEIIYLQIKDKFEKINYFEAYDMLNLQNLTFDLAELITDIYQDIKDFILLYQKNTFSAQENALLACRRNFYERWGKHITFLMPYLHQILYPNQIGMAQDLFD